MSGLDGFRPNENDLSEEERALYETLKPAQAEDLYPRILLGQHVEEWVTTNPVGKAVVTKLERMINECQMTWLTEPDPTSQAAIEAHQTAKSANMLMTLLDEMLKDAKDALSEADQRAMNKGARQGDRDE